MLTDHFQTICCNALTDLIVSIFHLFCSVACGSLRSFNVCLYHFQSHTLDFASPLRKYIVRYQCAVFNNSGAIMCVRIWWQWTHTHMLSHSFTHTIVRRWIVNSPSTFLSFSLSIHLSFLQRKLKIRWNVMTNLYNRNICHIKERYDGFHKIVVHCLDSFILVYLVNRHTYRFTS